MTSQYQTDLEAMAAESIGDPARAKRTGIDRATELMSIASTRVAPVTVLMVSMMVSHAL